VSAGTGGRLDEIRLRFKSACLAADNWRPAAR